jgi:dienelactone hydrolase
MSTFERPPFHVSPNHGESAIGEPVVSQPPLGERSGVEPVMVRSLYTAGVLQGRTAPFDRVQMRVFYPAEFTGTQQERMSGMLPVASGVTRLPVVVFLPGVNVTIDSYRWFAEFLVAQGFVVVLPWVIESMGPGMTALTAGVDRTASSPAELGSRPACFALEAILSTLADLDASGSPLAGHLDLTRVAFGGHSAGGSMALLSSSARWFPSLRCTFTFGAHLLGSQLAGWEPGSVMTVSNDTVPLLLMAGTQDGVIAASAVRYGETAETREDPMRRTFARGLPDPVRARSHLVLIEGADHFAIVNPVDATAARSFLEPATPFEAPLHRELICALSESFLRLHLYGDEAGAQTLTTLLAQAEDCVLQVTGPGSPV